MWGIEVEAGDCGLIFCHRCQHKARVKRALFFGCMAHVLNRNLLCIHFKYDAKY